MIYEILKACNILWVLNGIICDGQPVVCMILWSSVRLPSTELSIGFINANIFTLHINYLCYCGSVVEHYYKNPIQINCYKMREYFIARRINQTEDVGVDKEAKTRNFV